MTTTDVRPAPPTHPTPHTRPPQSHEAGPLDRGRIPSLDGLRAVAVVMVLLAHACQTHGFPEVHALKWLGIRGGIGVEVFFVISGFLITTLLLREHQRNGRLDVRAFYVRRALRILPAYFAYLAVVYVLSVFGQALLQQRDWIAALTYTMNFLHAPTWEVGHIWSLSIEEHFYLIWPAIMALGGVALARRTAVFFIVACFSVRWVVLVLFPRQTPMAELWTFTRLDTIAFGCLLAIATWQPEWRARLDRLCSRNLVVAGAAVALLVSVFGLAAVSAKYAVGIGYTFHAAMITLLLWAAVRRGASTFGRFLNHPLVAAVGVGSYSLYLWQQIFLNPRRDGFINHFPQNLLFACVAALVSYWCVERPFLTLKGKMGTPESSKAPSKPDPAPAAAATQA